VHIHQPWNRTGLILAPVFAVIVVAGCGGGGGGGGGGAAGTPGAGNPGFSYPTSLMAATTADIGGFSAAYSLNKGTHTLSSIAPGAGGTVTINLNSPSTGAYTVNVSAIPHPPPTAPEALFSFQVIPANLNGNRDVPGTGCGGCFRTGIPTATDGQIVNFIDLDLAAAQMTYSTLGLWTKPSAGGPAAREVGGGFSFGVLTRGVDLPTTGSATYNGPMLGRFADGSDVFTVGAVATARANFGGTPVVIGPSNVPARSVAFTTSGTTTTSSLGAIVAAPTLNLTGSFSYTPGSNQLNSTVFSTVGGALSGTASASFYGPPATTTPFAPPEFGGAFAVTNGTTQSMVGAFALKR
jgi:hypothetical protein